ncbi:anaerobic ribonucleoside-triphosphate reductase, partial [Bradyrhizobium liaoningense]
GGSSSSSSLLIRSKNPRRCQAENPLKLLSEFAGPALSPLSSGAACKKLVRRALSNFRLPYVTVTPTFSVCPTHGYLEGEHAFCPKCDAERLAAKRHAAAH